MLQHYSDLFRSTADGVFVLDVDGTILLSNPRATTITGYADPDLVGRPLLDLLVSAESEQWQGLLHRWQKELPTDRVDLRLRHKSGLCLTLNLGTAVLLSDDHAIVLMFRDVTRERVAEIELRQSKEFLERVIDNSIEAIVVSDMSGRVRLFNRAAQHCFGYTAEEVIGHKRIDELYPPGVGEDLMRLVLADGHGGSGRLEEHRCDIVDASGRRVPVTVSVALLHDHEPTACITQLTDLRERPGAEDRLEPAEDELRAREKQTAIAELAGAAAHELNQPLTSVMGYAQLLRRRLEHDGSTRELADVILAEAERMAEIVRKIGRITKYETKSYVGTAKILDIDKASKDDAGMTSKSEDGS